MPGMTMCGHGDCVWPSSRPSGAPFRGAADAIVYATALAYEAELVTCDKHLDGLPGVTLIAKTRG